MSDDIDTTANPRARLKPRFSSLTGAEVDARRRAIGISKNQLGRVIGVGETMIREYLSGRRDGKLPVSFDLAFELGQYDPRIWYRSLDETRTRNPNRKKLYEADKREEASRDER